MQTKSGSEAKRRKFIVLDVTDCPSVKRYLQQAARFDHRTLTSFLLKAGCNYADALKNKPEGWKAKNAPEFNKQWRSAKA